MSNESKRDAGAASKSESNRTRFQDVVQVAMNDPSRRQTFQTRFGTAMTLTPDWDDPRVDQPGTVVPPFVASPSAGAMGPSINSMEEMLKQVDFRSNPSRHPLTKTDLLEYKRRIGAGSPTEYDAVRFSTLSMQVGCGLPQSCLFFIRAFVYFKRAYLIVHLVFSCALPAKFLLACSLFFCMRGFATFSQRFSFV